MTKITFVTLFPNFIKPFLDYSIIKRAIDKKLVDIRIVNLRDYAFNKHHKVDDTPYGGSAGMVISIEPVYECLKAIKTNDSFIINTNPIGKVFDQNCAKELSNKKDLIIICGHYEGIDARIKHFINESYSIGDFILTGGEIPAMGIIEAVIRLIPDVISANSLDSESFDDYLLDHEVYTKPSVFKGYEVPSILLSGNHGLIKKYQEEQRIELTKKYREDLYKKYLKLRKDKENA